MPPSARGIEPDLATGAADATAFSLFISESGAEPVTQPPAARSSILSTVARPNWRGWTPPAGLPSTVAAFALGLAVGASLLVWQTAESPGPSSSMPSLRQTAGPALRTEPLEPRPPEPAAASARSQQAEEPANASSPANRSQPVTRRASAEVPTSRAVSARAGGVSTPSGGYGTLRVESRPPGARIAVDGKDLGVTPIVLERIRIGSHVVRLELEGHQVSGSAVRVVAGRATRVTIALDPTPLLSRSESPAPAAEAPK